MGDANVVEGIGQGAAEHAEDEEQDNHFGRVGEEGQIAAVDKQHAREEVEAAKKVLVGSDGDGTVMVDEFNNNDGEHHGNEDGTGQPSQADGVGVEVAFAAEEKHDREADERENDAHECDAFDFLLVGQGHAKGDEEGNGGHDDGGHAATDQLHSAGFADAVDEGFAQSQ